MVSPQQMLVTVQKQRHRRPKVIVLWRPTCKVGPCLVLRNLPLDPFTMRDSDGPLCLIFVQTVGCSEHLFPSEGLEFGHVLVRELTRFILWVSRITAPHVFMLIPATMNL